MRGNFSESFEHVLGHEGGYQRDPRDRGNWTSGQIGVGENKGTKWGISAMSYPHLDIKNLTKADAQAIYARDYWGPIQGDRLPMGVDLAVFDAAVNSGRTRAAQWLQHVVGAEMDGLIGEETLAKLETMDPAKVVADYNRNRLDFMQRIPTWNVYGRGWRNRVNAIQRVAGKMTTIAPDVFEEEVEVAAAETPIAAVPEVKPVVEPTYTFTEAELLELLRSALKERKP